MNKRYLLIAIIVIAACKPLTKISTGLKLMPHNITDTEILKISKENFQKDANIGKLDSNYLARLLVDSTSHDAEDSLARVKFLKFAAQPLNCMFFDDSNKLIAAYAICDADYKKLRFTWTYYLSKPYLTKNITTKHKMTFAEMQKSMIILEPAATVTDKKNVILIWSKIGGRQTKHFFKEFYDYLTKHQYNIFIMNCDAAFSHVDFDK